MGVDIAAESSRDPETLPLLRELMGAEVDSGWTASVELTLESGCIMRSTRVYIPSRFRRRVLEESHFVHFGIGRMKVLARSYVFWPRIDSDIEQMGAACDACKRGKTTTGVRVPIHPWEYPGGAWQRVHADFFDWEKKKFLIIVDAFSKWIEVFVMTTTTVEATISKMRECFARFGLPVILVMDNGLPWKSDKFQDFLSTNGIKHLTRAPYFPQSQRQVERYVATVKQGLKIVAENESITMCLNNLLMVY